jgi:hypothetical protein
MQSWHPLSYAARTPGCGLIGEDDRKTSTAA